MAESVQRHMEAMTEEIEELGRTNMFTSQEMKIILRKRREFEYKINGVTKDLQDIKDYIQYEKVFLKQIRLRRDKFRVADKKQSIEFKIIKRIKTLYEIAILRDPTDYSICLAFFKFCKQFNYHQVATYQIKNMLKMFSHKPEIFQIAAAWYMKKDKNEALNIIHKGLTIHENNKSLYLDAIGLELSPVNTTGFLAIEKANSSSLSCTRLNTYIELIFKNIKDFNFIIDILKLLEPHDYTRTVQNVIVDELLKQYSDEEIVWHTVAQRERNGFHYKIQSEEATKSTRFRLDRCIKTYQEGLRKIPENKKSALWCLYLETLIEAQSHTSTVASVLRTSTLKNAFEEATSSGVKLEEKHYAAWAELCGEDEPSVVKILEKATSLLPQSCLLWQLYLKFYIIKDNVTEVNKVFKRAIRTLHSNKTEPIWSMFLGYHLLLSSDDIIESIYLDAIQEPEEVCNIFKPQYITWVLLTKGIKEAREAYDSIATKKPYCKELHLSMAKIEASESPGAGQNYEEWVKCLHLACEQFGGEDIDVWLSYVNFYLVEYHTYDTQERVQNIVNEAEKRLPPMLLCDFKEQFANVMANADAS